mgnify:CR=1 FL=1
MHNSTINEYCKAAKDQAYPKITNQDICDRTNISESAVNNFFRGATKNPSVYLVGDICKALDVSLDEYFKLNSEQAPDLVEKIRVLEEASNKLEIENHELKIQNVELSGELENAKSEVSHQKEKADFLRAQLATRRPVIYTLLCVCVVMAFTLLVYIILDANMPDVGFIRYGHPSAAAWAVIAVIAAATIIIAWSIIRAVRNPKKVKK